jgi:transcriptional regulator with XRE-family HTH domain
MAGRHSPTLRRVELSRRLRQLREGSGLSIENVSAELLCSPSKISRIETGARAASVRDVRDLARLYGVDEVTTTYLMNLAREAKERGWWQHFDEVVSEYATYVDFEQAATEIHQYETIVVPGLLQVPDYTLALMRRVSIRLRGEAAEQYAASRQQRQERLALSDAPQFWAVIDEAVLHRQVGGIKVMQEQLTHLIRSVNEERVVLQVIPFSAGAHASMEGSFTLLRFEEAEIPDLVYIEGRAGHLFLSRQVDLKLYRDTFDHLRASALSPDDSLELLKTLVT